MSQDELPDPLPPGYSIGSYEILSEMRRAGMGRMYKAASLGRNRLVVAVNVLDKELRTAEGNYRFRQRIQKALAGPAPLLDIGVWLGVDFVVVGCPDDGREPFDVSL